MDSPIEILLKLLNQQKSSWIFVWILIAVALAVVAMRWTNGTPLSTVLTFIGVVLVLFLLFSGVRTKGNNPIQVSSELRVLSWLVVIAITSVTGLTISAWATGLPEPWCKMVCIVKANSGSTVISEPVPPAPVLPSPPLPNALPPMLPECEPVVKQFDNYLAEYKRQVAAKNPVLEAQALTTLGVISTCVKRITQAELEFETAIGKAGIHNDLKSRQVTAEARFNFGLLYRDSSRPEKAFEQFSLGAKAIQTDPPLQEVRARLILNRGVVELELPGQCQTALKSFNEALNLYGSLGNKATRETGVNLTKDWINKTNCS